MFFLIFPCKNFISFFIPRTKVELFATATSLYINCDPE